ncbi:MAG TPA: DegT/DnrJ/EryC1/StrS family aminotransferase, partial [Candidatus Sumerlaeota bacterium]|nr:DegT/DnrJ/EryC1/StrS family aminotransferase [Candidatus Sumerlaeota bacterium]
MAPELKPFPEPVYITRPILPDLHTLETRLQQIWSTAKLTNQGRQHLELEERVRQFLKVPALSLFNNGTI